MAEKKKIAVMTWYTYRNFGTALQASAMAHTLGILGYNAEFIQYYPKSRHQEVQKITFKSITTEVKERISNYVNYEYVSEQRETLFYAYQKEKIKETAICRTYPELYALNDLYEAFVCGSDQIWSPLCYDEKYFLAFVSNPKKMIAYAPSFGTTEISNSLIKEKISHYISRFEHISVREQQAANLIEKITDKKAEVVLDPTLLLDANTWDEYVGTVESKVNGEYIICYFLGNSAHYMKYVQKLSEKMNIPYYVIPVRKKQYNHKNAIPFEIGPKEFVALIRSAKYVCTDSFHGMAFSINYNVPFSVFKRFGDNNPKNQNSRVISLLEILGLRNRLINYKEIDKINECQYLCDFTIANKRLEKQREQSLKYLKKALEEATKEFCEGEKKTPFKITDMCCGCGACATICPKDVITITRSEDGFEKYNINQDKCIRCGQCQSVCPMRTIGALDMKTSLALYSIKSKNDEVLKVSSSGGIGHEIARYSQAEGRYLCGCMYDSNENSAKHVIITPDETDKLRLLQGSKYIQSVSAQAIKEIVKIAETEKIAFFGTPCQVAAVENLLTKKRIRDNAILVDLICHGVPTQLLWEKYLKDINLNYGIGSSPKVVFRSKENGWRQRWLVVEGNGKDYKKKENKDDFYAFFRRGLCDLESCSDCPYRERSAADLRIGDYWGTRFKSDKQGVSMVIANTIRGRDLISNIEKAKFCSVQEQDLEEYWKVQYPYNSHRPLVRERILADLKNDDKSLHEMRIAYCTYYDQMERLRLIWKQIKKVFGRNH